MVKNLTKGKVAIIAAIGVFYGTAILIDHHPEVAAKFLPQFIIDLKKSKTVPVVAEPMSKNMVIAKKVRTVITYPYHSVLSKNTELHSSHPQEMPDSAYAASRIISRLKSDMPIYIHQKQSGFYEISVGGLSGWVKIGSVRK